jgi:hypothetical protein
MAHYNNTHQDNGGVHINSGIPNRAFALACREVGGYAWEKVGKIWYVAHTTRAKHDTDFQGYANLTWMVAGELFGPDSAEQVAVANGWKAVGIDATVQSSPNPQPSPVPSSPCANEIAAILADPPTVAKLRALGENPHVARLLAALHSAIK